MWKSFTTYIEKWAQRYFPQIYYRLVQKPRFRRRFVNERKLVRGEQLATSNHPSILFFTHPKCASRYVHEILTRLAVAEGLVPIDFDALVTVEPQPLELNPYSLEGSMTAAFSSRGYYYGPIGSLRAIPAISNYRNLVHLRDPRDVLTSLYYSTAFSHALITPKLIRKRKEALTLSVDEFVHRNSDEVLRAYTGYAQLANDPEYLFVKYEDMVLAFESWLIQVASFLDLAHHKAVLEQIIAEADFIVAREDQYSQKRQVTPGDYLRKLQPETISGLNEKFSAVLMALDYPS